MKTIKKKAWFVALLLGSMALAACGGSNNAKKSSSSQQQASQSQSQAQSSASASESASASVSESSSSSKRTRSSSSGVDYSNLPSYEVKIDAKDGSDAVVSQVKHGRGLEKPANPTAPAGKVFYGWMNTKNGGQIWDFDNEVLNVVMDDVALEPLFIDASLDEHLLETELCPEITEANNGAGMDGATYSGGQKGKGMIYRGYNGEYGISGSFFEEDDGDVRLATESDPADEVFGGCLHFNYIYGNTVSYEITSDVAVDNAVIFMRLCAEYGQERDTGDVICRFTDDMFQIKVNDTALEYGEITIHNIDPKFLMDFQDYYVKTTVSLQQGANKIELVVNNNVTLNGTISSTAPCVDCVKLYSTSNIEVTNALMDNLIKD